MPKYELKTIREWNEKSNFAPEGSVRIYCGTYLIGWCIPCVHSYKEEVFEFQHIESMFAIKGYHTLQWIKDFIELKLRELLSIILK